MPNTKQADGNRHGDQLRSFLVKRVDEKDTLGLGANAELNAEDVYEVLVGASADEDLDI